MWEEDNIAPILTLEVVSQMPGGEYEEKLSIYEQLGVLYYIVYNPDYWQRDRHQPFEVYRLVNGTYRLQIGEPFWMAEIGLGIGRATTQTGGLEREVLSWYNQQGVRFLTPEEQLARYRERFGDLLENG